MKLISAIYSSEDPFGIFSSTSAATHPEDLDGGDALILWGGEDISPSLYNQLSVHAHSTDTPSRRDIIERNLFDAAVKRGMPVIGICRGAQLACALSGGSLFQHINGGHHATHEIETYDGQFMRTSSCHHQALNLDNVQHELLAWDRDRTTRVFTDKDALDIVIPEVMVLNKTKVFAIQGHPEWMPMNSTFVQWCANEFQKRF